MIYTWDPAKRERVLAEHRVNFEKICDVFEDPFAIEDIDDDHSSKDEIRFTIIGLTREYGLVFLAFSRSHDS